MPLVTRQINNVGDPLVDSSGTILAGVAVSFTLVDVDNSPCDAWDAISSERVAPIRETVTTDEFGEFSINLWPNDRGSTQTSYRCSVRRQNVRSILAALPEDDLSPIKWINFVAGSEYISAYPLEFYKGEKGDDGYTPVKGVDYFDGGQGPAGSDATVTKENVEAVLTGTVTSHDHEGTYVPIIIGDGDGPNSTITHDGVDFSLSTWEGFTGYLHRIFTNALGLFLTSTLKIDLNAPIITLSTLTVDTNTLHVGGGKVGIGIGAPTEALHIHEAAAATNKLIKFSNATHAGIVGLVGMGTGVGFGTTTNSDVIIYSNNLERVKLKADGKVGIGISAPGGLLDVYYSATSRAVALDNGDGILFASHATSNTVANSIGIVAGTSYNGTGVKFHGSTHATSPGKIAFVSNSATRMTIDSNGNVGIGTATPYAKLEVNGGDVYIWNNGNNPRFLIGDSASGGGFGGFRWDSTNDLIQIGTDTGGYVLNLAETGNVGIGTTNPAGKLSVSDGTYDSLRVIDGFTYLAGCRLYRLDSEVGDATSWMLDAQGNYIRIGPRTGTTMFEVVNTSEVAKFGVYDLGVGVGTTSPSASMEVVGDSFPVFAATRDVTTTDTFASTFVCTTRSSGNAVDGHGGGIVFNLKDTGVTDQLAGLLGSIGAVRAGADNTGALVFRAYVAGNPFERMRIDSGGVKNAVINDLSNYVDADALHQIVFLNIGSAATMGMPVSAVTWNGANSAVEVSKANNTNATPCLGLMESAGADGTVQSVRTSGILNNVNTSAFSEGVTLYVGASGLLTATRPTTVGQYVKVVGTVVRQHATLGVINVHTDSPTLISAAVTGVSQAQAIAFSIALG